MKQIAEKLRNGIFWSLDALKGGKLKSHYKDVAQILENYDTPYSLERRKELLNNLLRHACDTTEFYGAYKKSKNLSEYPVVDKDFIRNKFEAFQSSEYKNRPKQQVSTSGSSGTPFRVYQNREKVLRNRADTLYFQKIAGYEVGYRLYYIRKWLSKYQMSRLISKLRNIEMVDVTDFTDVYLDKFIETLKADTSTKVLLCYSSALRDICKYLERIDAGPIDTAISSIIAMAEGLGDDTREKLKYYFDAPVYLRYSNQENGILSLQVSQKNTNLQINWASYFIEILHPDTDKPVKNGELGRVVVTDLFNYCMPFIRYDTGDLAVMTDENPYFEGSCVFSKVEGRKMDVIRDTQGNVISGFNILHLESYPEIRQFQFIQENRTKYHVKIAVNEPLNQESEIIANFKSFLGADAEIGISYVNEISQLESGKRRLVINKYQGSASNNEPDTSVED